MAASEEPVYAVVLAAPRESAGDGLRLRVLC